MRSCGCGLLLGSCLFRCSGFLCSRGFLGCCGIYVTAVAAVTIITVIAVIIAVIVLSRIIIVIAVIISAGIIILVIIIIIAAVLFLRSSGFLCCGSLIRLILVLGSRGLFSSAGSR